jgi:pimeloyl-ACP methyl ester carboxylesterase
MAEKFLDVVADIDVVGLLPNVKMPSLILHCRDDALIPFSLGQELASRISGANSYRWKAGIISYSPMTPRIAAF